MRAKDPAAVRTDQVSPHLEVLLPFELRVVGVGDQARAALGHGQAGGLRAEVDAMRLTVRLDGQAGGEGEAVGPDPCEDGGLVAPPELVETLVPCHGASLRRLVRLERLLALPGADLLEVGV